VSSNPNLKEGLIAGVPVVCGFPSNGDAPLTIVYIHGMLGCTKHFERWMENTIGAYFNACAVVLASGHGTSFKNQLSAVEAVIKEIHKNRKDHSIMLVGHGVGGLIAMAICSQHDGLVDGFIPVGSFAPKGIGKSAPIWRHMRYRWASLTGRLFTLLEPHALDHVLNMYCSEEGRQLFREFKPESGRLLRDVTRGVKVGRFYHCKALLVFGTHDRIVPPETQVEISERYDLETFECDCGHLIPVEDDGPVFAKIRSMAIGIVSHKRRKQKQFAA
jgi:pimeloyl-ACP methyl ester carboxylesterase